MNGGVMLAVTTWQVSLLAVYCLLVAVSSLLGGFLPAVVRITHHRLQMLVSGVGGLMVGVALFHQLPHAIVALQDGGVEHGMDLAMMWAVAGLITMFLMLRAFHLHQHVHGDDPHGNHGHHHDHDHDHGHSRGTPTVSPLAVMSALPASGSTGEETGTCNHPDHEHRHELPPTSTVITDALLPVLQHEASSGGHRFGWVAITLGLVIHTLIDGMALAAAVQSDALHLGGSALFGIGTFVAIALHKPLDSLSITSLMLASGWSVRSRALVNFGYALMCPAGAVLFHLGVQQFTGQQAVIVGAALAFSAGAFLCIALADLLPEVQFHSHDRLPLSAMLLGGTIVAWGIGYLEPEHRHGGSGHNHAGHDHSDHDHGGDDHRHEHSGKSIRVPVLR